MNYVLYLIGIGCIVAAFLGLGKTIETQNVFANMIVIYVSGSLTLSGVIFCAMGSAIGLLKNSQYRHAGIVLAHLVMRATSNQRVRWVEILQSTLLLLVA